MFFIINLNVQMTYHTDSQGLVLSPSTSAGLLAKITGISMSKSNKACSSRDKGVSATLLKAKKSLLDAYQLHLIFSKLLTITISSVVLAPILISFALFFLFSYFKKFQQSPLLLKAAYTVKGTTSQPSLTELAPFLA